LINDAMEGQVRVAVVPVETKWEMWQMVEVCVGVQPRVVVVPETKWKIWPMGLIEVSVGVHGVVVGPIL
jgi:hypothetical protein